MLKEVMSQAPFRDLPYSSGDHTLGWCHLGTGTVLLFMAAMAGVEYFIGVRSMSKPSISPRFRAALEAERNRGAGQLRSAILQLSQLYTRIYIYTYISIYGHIIYIYMNTSINIYIVYIIPPTSVGLGVLAVLLED